MCGRFQLSIKGKHISERYNIEVYDELYRPSFNCAPSQKLPIITNIDSDKLSFFKWGLIPFWAKDPSIGIKLINAKSETIHEKASFKNAFKRQRCVVPCNGFYEWKKNKDKTPYRIFLKNEAIFSLAGIWERWKDSEGRVSNTFSILTTSPNKLMEGIHNRMPVILSKKHEEDWLKEKDASKLISLFQPYPEKEMEAYPISKLVNSPINNSEDIIKPTGNLSLDF